MPVGFEVEDVWQSRNRGFQMGAVQQDGIVIHLTGQVAWSAKEEVIGKGDVEAQTRQIFDNISKLLRKVGGELSDIVAITTYFTDRAQLPLIQKVRAEYLEAGHEPVSTSVMVAGLGHEDFLVELTPIAVIPERRFKHPQRRCAP
jgi:2-iminobutanoate/2-iminopropanoate deaminase